MKWIWTLKESLQLKFACQWNHTKDNALYLDTTYTSVRGASKTPFSDMLHGLDSVTTTEDTAHHTAILFSQRFYTKRALLTEKLLHRRAFTESKLLYTEAFTHSSLCTETLLHTASFCTQQTFTQSNSSYTEKRLHKASFCAANLFHAANFCAKQAFAQRKFYTKQAFALRLSSRVSATDCKLWKH